MICNGKKFFFYLVIVLPLFAQAQFYRIQSDQVITSTAPTQPNMLQNQIGIIKPGSVIEVLEAQAKAVRIKLWLIANRQKFRAYESMWIYKNDEDPQTRKDFIEIFPARMETISSRAVTEAKSPAINCTDGSCDNNTASEATKSNQENIENLKDVTEDVSKQNHNSGLNLNSNLAEQIRNYSDSPEVATMLKHAKTNKRSRSTGQCYKFVKDAMMAKAKGKKALMPIRHTSWAGSKAEQALQEYDFINLLKTPPYDKIIVNAIDAPKGAVLVYSSDIKCSIKTNGRKITENHCGHTEIKIDEPGKPGYISDFYSNNPITNSIKKRPNANYKLIGVMVKPMDKNTK